MWTELDGVKAKAISTEIMNVLFKNLPEEFGEDEMALVLGALKMAELALLETIKNSGSDLKVVVEGINEGH